MSAEENECVWSREQSRQCVNGVKWELESLLPARTLHFVERIGEQYMCPVCNSVVLNPHQAGCGHIFCYQCIRTLMDSQTSPKCPLDNMLIKSDEVFQDNCCRRELLNLEVYCTNASSCSHKITLRHLQDHLKCCEYESVECSNQGCAEETHRKDLLEHQQSVCSFRLELCTHCRKAYPLAQLKKHGAICPEAEVDCPKCVQRIRRNKVHEHVVECPEEETDCSYRKYGCSTRAKRALVQVHEKTEFNHHVLLILESNSKLEKQVEDLQQDLVHRHSVLQDHSLLVNTLDREVTKCDRTLTGHSCTLEEQRECVSSVQQQLQALRCVLGADLGQDQLQSLRASLDSLRQRVDEAEALREHLGVLEQTAQRHSRLLSIHVEQLQSNEERFRHLESTSYDGKLIWKVREYRRRKESGAPLSATPFYTSRSGYKLSARVYLGGDGPGRGTHLSLYLMLMRGDFDSLLPWPFHQPVVLSVLDQSGGRNHLTMGFTPDPDNDSFYRPRSEANKAAGYQLFVSHANLETPKNAVYVRDDTLFIKVQVDTVGLEDL
ncbi:TNF receptor-associated factor 5 isoform X2 [Clupea harengus]|nr:TNF receptor-associated factor 5 isoform X2 [Clupea harengus]XP_031419402.1 TNF receptor-associated factor 5 isoform X2 [Clupea harengus]XP_031419403.1 TNF receptor-associated factor 5 isoform X2 [Clupea harengus]